MNRKKPNRRRQIRKELNFSSNEWQMIETRIKRTRCNNFSEYARHMLIDGLVFVIDDSDKLKQVAYEVNKVGNNINQIAHVANSSGNISHDDIEKVLYMQASIWQSLRSILYKDPFSLQ